MIRSGRAESFSFLTVLFIALLLTACRSSEELIELRLINPDGSQTPDIKAELALTHAARNRGLMYRKELEENRGMLFVFPDEEERSFWMKNTYLELDMIFIDSAFEVISVIHRATPLTTSARPSKGPCRYVLEVPGGRAEAWGVRAGSRLETTGEIPEPR